MYQPARCAICNSTKAFVKGKLLDGVNTFNYIENCIKRWKSRRKNTSVNLEINVSIWCFEVVNLAPISYK